MSNILSKKSRPRSCSSPAAVAPADGETEQASSASKRLRCGEEPDLKVFVGKERSLFRYYSVNLATHSEYVDTLLATPMSEAASRELSFPDVDPEIWEKMISLLEDPLAVLDMTVEDAVGVLPLYDKYQFHRGKDLCGRVLSKFISDMNDTADLDQLIDVLLVADSSEHLEHTREIGVEALQKRLQMPNLRIMFTVSQIERLVPLLQKEERLLEAIGLTETQVGSPLFAEYLVLRFGQSRMREDLNEAIKCLKVYISGGPGKIDGVRLERSNNDPNLFQSHQYSEARWAGPNSAAKLAIQRNGSGEVMFQGIKIGDWIIVWRNHNTVLFTCPQSFNVEVPPKRGWIPIHGSAQGCEARLEIVYNH